MTIEEAISERLRALPPEKQQEILDFAEFLYQKHRETEQSPSLTQPGDRVRLSTSPLAAGAIDVGDSDNSKPTSPDPSAMNSAMNGDSFAAYVEYDSETKLYVGMIPGIRGAHTQAETLDELQANLKEVLELCLEEYGGNLENLPQFVGIQRIEVGA